jgi:hypothetical protein
MALVLARVNSTTAASGAVAALVRRIAVVLNGCGHCLFMTSGGERRSHGQVNSTFPHIALSPHGSAADHALFDEESCEGVCGRWRWPGMRLVSGEWRAGSYGDAPPHPGGGDLRRHHAMRARKFAARAGLGQTLARLARLRTLGTSPRASVSPKPFSGFGSDGVIFRSGREQIGSLAATGMSATQ